MGIYKNPLRNLWHKVRRFPTNVHNLIKWFPVIWRDRDFDQYYLLKVMEFKMSEMAKLHREYGVTEGKFDTADQLEQCVSLIQKITEGNYTDEAFGDERYLLDRTRFDFVDTPDGTTRMRISGLTEEETARKMELYMLEEKLLEKDYDLLFETMRKYIRTWWD